jgi:FkbM family methyltransferase
MNLINLQQEAIDCLKQDKYSEAIALYEQCIQLDPTDISNYWHLGLALLLQGEELEAQAVWFSAISQNFQEGDTKLEELINFLQLKADNYLHTESYQKAEQIYLQLIELAPANIDNYKNNCVCLVKQNRLNEAIDYLYSALNIEQNNFVLDENLANLAPETLDNNQAKLGNFTKINCLKQCRYGYMLYNIHDIFIGRSLELYGEFSETEIELLKQIVQPGNLVLDVGANFGTHTVFFAEAVGLEGAVIAFEPQRIVFQSLCANVALNSILNTYTYNVAVGETEGFIMVPPINYSTANNIGGFSLGTFSHGETVKVITIDSLVLPKCHLIKIDVQGMELQVLKGAVTTINQFKPFLYVENDQPEKSDDLIRYIHSLGYNMYWHNPPLYNPNNYFKNSENVFGNIVSLNMLCVHRSVELKVEGFQAVEIPGSK